MRSWFLPWCATRMRPFVVVAPLVALASGSERLLERAALALALLLALRLWDDLASLDEDRVRAPERVLCRVTSSTPAWLVVALLLACAPFVDAIALGCLTAGALVVYARRSPGLLRAHLVLLKYPALVFVLRAGEVGPGVLLAAFGLAGLYELAHDARWRRHPRLRLFLSLDAFALVGGVLLPWSAS